MPADVARWDGIQSVDLWNRRTDFCLDLLFEGWEPPEHLWTFMDVGCGARYAETALAARGHEVVYLPVDCAKRGQGSLVIDLDDVGSARAMLPRAHVAYFGGVLEYLADPVATLRAIPAPVKLIAYCAAPGIDGRAISEDALLKACDGIGTILAVRRDFAPCPIPVTVVLLSRDPKPALAAA